MGVVVRKSSTVVVRPPPEPMTATVNINLSPLDKNVMSVPAAVFMVFDGRIPEPAATIERALSQALAHYSPVSGRLAAGAEQGEFHIRCTGEGVPFVEAEAACDLALIGDLSTPDPAALGQLVYSVPGTKNILKMPPLMAQVWLATHIARMHRYDTSHSF